VAKSSTQVLRSSSHAYEMKTLGGFVSGIDFPVYFTAKLPVGAGLRRRARLSASQNDCGQNHPACHEDPPLPYPK
jgi:hypothetical protein